MSAITNPDQLYIRRCFTLARRGIGHVSPNPPVGAVLVYQDKIIGEGYHQRFGGPHAEVEAVKSVASEHRHLIPASILYVSLEPCCITGKTPPCTNLILAEKIKDVRISTPDPNPLVAGQGIEILRQAGVQVQTGILEEEGKELIRMFAVNILLNRPYVILKWAQSKYGYVGQIGKRILLSHPHTLQWSHRLRAESDAIMVGARTVQTDNPSLTTRHATGDSPVRVIYDPGASLDETYLVFQNMGQRIVYFSATDNSKITAPHIEKLIFPSDEVHVDFILDKLNQQKIGILLVEGGTYLLNMFITEEKWDEAWVIQTDHSLADGVKAPNLRGLKIDKFRMETDTVIGIRQNRGTTNRT